MAWRDTVRKVVASHPSFLVRHQLDSFDHFVTRRMDETVHALNTGLEVFKDKDGVHIQVTVAPGGVRVARPDGGMTPASARLRSATYAAAVTCDVDVVYTGADGQRLEQRLTDVALCRLPVMVRSSLCHTHGLSAAELRAANECPYDLGGYFIVEGREKVVMAQEDVCVNRLFLLREPPASDFSFHAFVTCINPAVDVFPQSVGLSMRKDTDAIMAAVPQMGRGARVPLTVLFRALGVESDRAIARACCGDLEGSGRGRLSVLRASLLDNRGVWTQEQAEAWLAQLTKYRSEVNARYALERFLFPNLPEPRTPAAKARYLGRLVRRLLDARLSDQVLATDGRDNYANRRTQLSGGLIADIFRDFYNLFRRNVRDMLDREYETTKRYGAAPGTVQELVTRSNLRRIFDANIITEALMRSFRGAWGADPDRDDAQGIVQDLNRISYISAVSHLRRITSPLSDAAKVVEPHRLLGPHWGYLCPCESPDGANIGLIKNLALLAHITHTHEDTDAVAGVIARFVTDDVDGDVDVSLNNTPVGATRQPLRLAHLLRALKRTGAISPYTGIAYNVLAREVSVLTEAGRACRPLLALPLASRGDDHDDNNLLGKGGADDAHLGPGSEALDTLQGALRAVGGQPGRLEYLDAEESGQAMVAMWEADVGPDHTHLEIHPSTVLSLYSASIPFAHHNQAPRNVMSGAQGKQALGVYATTLNSRMDTLAYTLAYPQVPLITTHVTELVSGTRCLPNGENLIVAIMAFTGYNQEDSLILNKSSVERGMFGVTAGHTLRFDEDGGVAIANPASDPTCALRADVAYDMLDEHGLPRAGAPLVEGAALLGMIADGRDVSPLVDHTMKGMVHRTLIHQHASDASRRVRKVQLRHWKQPELGDKMCLTPDHDVLTSAGWVPVADVTLSHEVCVLQADGVMRYERPTALHRYECADEELVRVQSAHVDLLTTTNHRMYARPGRWQSFELVEARATLRNTQMTYKKNARNRSSGYRAPPGGFASFSACHRLPDWVWRASEKQCRALLGTLLEDARASPDDLQRLALHAGWAADIQQPEGKLVVIKPRGGRCEPEVDHTRHAGLVRYTGAVHCLEVPDHVFYVRRNGKPVWTGNSSRHGQKGVVGMLLPQEQMPYSAAGVTPDIIVNPHAFPSRMTIGHLIEAALAKVGAALGSRFDATCFQRFDLEAEVARAPTVERHGNEVLYDPRTGLQVEADICFTPTYYYRLKHMVSDKVQYRATGPRQPVTGQPVHGRTNKGGLRIGEMERDALASHGAAGFLKESFMERSDKTVAYVDRVSSAPTYFNPGTGVSGSEAPARVDMPRTLAVALHELAALAVEPRLHLAEEKLSA